MYEQMINELKNIWQIQLLVMVEKWWEIYIICQFLICSHPFVMCEEQMEIYGM
jgi:hypothetical protein